MSRPFLMFGESSRYLKFGGATLLILLAIGYLAYTGVQDSKSYYVTIKELRGMGDSAYARRLRVAGNVQPGSIKRAGTKVDLVLVENGQLLSVAYVQRDGSPARYLQRQFASAGRWQLWARRRLPREATPGKVRF